MRIRKKISFKHLIYAIILLILISTGSNNVYAIPEIEWTRTYGIYGSDIYSIVQTHDGGYIFAGGFSDVENIKKAWLVKTDQKGNLLWERKFGRSKEDMASSVVLTNDGGLIIAGLTTVYNTKIESYKGDLFHWILFNILSIFRETRDIWLMKTDENGTELWKEQFGEANIMSSPEVSQTSDGGYIIIGQAWTHDYDNKHAWLIKTDEKGKEEWSRKYGQEGIFDAHSGQQTRDGGFIIAGAGYDDQTAFLFKTDGKGLIQWKKRLAGIGNEKINSVHQTSDGGYIIAGKTSVYESDDGGAWLIKTDNEGNEDWNRTFKTKYDEAYSVKQAPDQGYIFTGWKEGEDDEFAMNEEAWIIKTEEKGNHVWNKSFGGWGYNRIFSIKETKDKGFIIAGMCGNKSTGSNPCLIKLRMEYP